ncbi:uncharacterized protein EI90DRAFT_2491034 [Cantharellus anzutake]|uniref:uncharacterized protein n=1 Tax=Cantharellus anzutake TaxID=1750568 RepID=UPI001903DCF7|nr:uncharacterized protein EI90DRAFT_2491034 [Cantharellus anzutake]KAF8322003.1 hypothetical protein EI90DRAFT_2491034 [Cantharellus anzutake]
MGSSDSAERSTYEPAQCQNSGVSEPVSTLPVRSCPKNGFVTWPSATWYELSVVPGISFCSSCCEKHIAATRFSQAFREISPLPPHPMNCGYWAPRVRLLFEGALKSGDLSPLVAYLEMRTSIPNCVGYNGYIPGPEPRTEWFTLKANINNPNNPLSNFIVCRACYDDVVMATPHHIHFRKHWRTQLHHQMWVCDLDDGWVRFVLDPFAPSNRDLGWDGVVTKLSSQFEKDCYQTSGNRSGFGLWWKLRDDLDDNSLAICDPCYASYIAPSDRVADFKFLSLLALSSDQGRPFLSCAISDFRLQTAWNMVTSSGLPTSAWCNAARMILHCNPCTSEGRFGGKWYRITLSPSLCNICPGCYYATFGLIGFGSHFSLYCDTGNPNIEADLHKRVCDLNPSQPRFAQLYEKIEEACAIRNFDVFLRYTQERVNLRPCPRALAADDSESRIWYGNGDSFISCEECYFDAIRTSPLAQHVLRCDPRGSLQNGFCMLWSDQMRIQWANACRRGDLTEFLELCKGRALVFQETVVRAFHIEEREREVRGSRGDKHDDQFGETNKEIIDGLHRQWEGWE